MFNLQISEHEKAFNDARKQIMEEKRNKNSHKIDLLTEVSNKMKYRDMGKNLYDPFDPIICEGKLKVDALYLSQLMKNLDESYIPKVEPLLVDLFRNVKSIYEFINIKPEVFGKGISLDILEESMNEINRKLSKSIFESLDATFYRLTSEERIAKYKDKSEDLVKTLINEGADADQAITFAIKTLVLENLLTKISFPFTCWTRVKHLTESQDYGLIFDQQQLIDLVESFEKKVKNIAKVITTCV